MYGTIKWNTNKAIGDTNKSVLQSKAAAPGALLSGSTFPRPLLLPRISPARYKPCILQPSLLLVSPIALLVFHLSVCAFSRPQVGGRTVNLEARGALAPAQENWPRFSSAIAQLSASMRVVDRDSQCGPSEQEAQTCGSNEHKEQAFAEGRRRDTGLGPVFPPA